LVSSRAESPRAAELRSIPVESQTQGHLSKRLGMTSPCQPTRRRAFLNRLRLSYFGTRRHVGEIDARL
jgi:hypothetical protein